MVNVCDVNSASVLPGSSGLLGFVQARPRFSWVDLFVYRPGCWALGRGWLYAPRTEQSPHRGFAEDVAAEVAPPGFVVWGDFP